MKELPIDDTTPMKEICDIFEENVKFICEQACDFIKIGELRQKAHKRLRKKDLDRRLFPLGMIAIILKNMITSPNQLISVYADDDLHTEGAYALEKAFNTSIAGILNGLKNKP